MTLRLQIIRRRQIDRHRMTLDLAECKGVAAEELMTVAEGLLRRLKVTMACYILAWLNLYLMTIDDGDADSSSKRLASDATSVLPKLFK